MATTRQKKAARGNLKKAAAGAEAAKKKAGN
jgi:hypothetical protein